MVIRTVGVAFASFTTAESVTGGLVPSLTASVRVKVPSSVQLNVVLAVVGEPSAQVVSASTPAPATYVQR